MPNLSHARIDSAIDDATALGDVGLERGDVIRLAARRGEQRLLAWVAFDARGKVGADHPLKCCAGARLPRHLATASICFLPRPLPGGLLSGQFSLGTLPLGSEISSARRGGLSMPLAQTPLQYRVKGLVS